MNNAGRVQRSCVGSRGHAAISPFTMASLSVPSGMRSWNVYDDAPDAPSALALFSVVSRNRLTSSLPPILSARCSSACFSVWMVLPLSLTISSSALRYSTNLALGRRLTGAFSIQTIMEHNCWVLQDQHHGDFATHRVAHYNGPALGVQFVFCDEALHVF